MGYKNCFVKILFFLAFVSKCQVSSGWFVVSCQHYLFIMQQVLESRGQCREVDWQSTVFLNIQTKNSSLYILTFSWTFLRLSNEFVINNWMLVNTLLVLHIKYQQILIFNVFMSLTLFFLCLWLMQQCLHNLIHLWNCFLELSSDTVCWPSLRLWLD